MGVVRAAFCTGIRGVFWQRIIEKGQKMWNGKLEIKYDDD